MKSKNCRVRLKDIKQGRIIYVASAEFNYINVYLIKSKPFVVNLGHHGLELFVKAHRISDNGNLSEYYDENCPSCHNSLRDMGVVNNTYNDRKTFFKRKQAEDYIKRMRSNFPVPETFIDDWYLDELQRYYDSED